LFVKSSPNLPLSSSTPEAVQASGLNYGQRSLCIGASGQESGMNDLTPETVQI
jgi:hypothetical protein